MKAYQPRTAGAERQRRYRLRQEIQGRAGKLDYGHTTIVRLATLELVPDAAIENARVADEALSLLVENIASDPQQFVTFVTERFAALQNAKRKA